VVIEKIIEAPFVIAKNEPKVLLPNILNWVPLSLFSLIILNAVTEFNRLFDGSLNDLLKIMETAPFTRHIIEFIIPYILMLIPIAILSIIISLFLGCVYPEIIKQHYSRRKILLSSAFSVAKSRIVSLFWTYFLEILIIFGVLIGVGGMSFLVWFINPVIGMLFLVILGFLFLVFLFLAIVFFWQTPTVVVIESKSGLDAIRSSYRIARNHFWQTCAVIFILWIVIGIINSAFSAIPRFGFIFSLLVGVFTHFWLSAAPAIFYYEYKNIKLVVERLQAALQTTRA
jgi:hypothetical protein